MSEFFKDLRALNINGEIDAGKAREAAVAAALVLIHAKVGNSPDKTETLKRELDNLSDYADKIQEALTVE